MKNITASIKKGNIHKILNQSKNYLMNFSNRLTIMISKVFRKINNKLNIYTELKNKYKFPNTSEEEFVYAMVAKNGLDNSIIKLIIVSKRNDNQLNYFNC